VLLGLSDAVLSHAIAHPFDTHPPTALRLQQLGVVLDDPLLSRATRAPTDYDRQWFSQLTSVARSTAQTCKNGISG